MINIKKFGAITTTGAVIFSLLAMPVLADTSITESGNGANSDSNVSVSTSNTSNVTQSNSADVTNTVNTTSNTGGNSASDNTGGNSSISTGVSNSTVGISNALNNNAAHVDGTGSMGTTNIDVNNNGASSGNSVNTSSDNTAGIFQNNSANVSNVVSANQTTGDNHANDNTNGSSSISTGMATSTVNMGTTANQNMASIGDPSLNGGSSDPMNLTISGNGKSSDNSIAVSNDQSATIEQGNSACVTNDVTTTQKSGDNSASDNTGGDSSVSTGATNSIVGLFTAVNNNEAQLGNDWVAGGDGLNVNTADNGAKSDNGISVDANNSIGVFQGLEGNGNDAHVLNIVANNGKTGFNHASDNTMGSDMVSTGVSNSTTNVSTEGNQNMFLSGGPFDFGFSWDLFGNGN